MKRILILGGTGAMGKHLTAILTAEGSNQVFVTSRSKRSSSQNNLVYLRGNAREWNWTKTILGSFDFDVVFDFMMYSKDEFEKRCLHLLKNCGHYFYFSSYRVLGEATTLTENSPVKLELLERHREYELDSYGLNKAIGERALRNSGMDNYTIVRPSMTFASDRFQFFAGDNFDVIRAVKGVPTLLPKSAVDSPTNLTYGKNVAKMLGELVKVPEVKGEIFHTVTKSMTWGEIALAYEAVFGMKYEVVADDEYLSLIGLEDGRILDRFRGRNLCNNKIMSFIDLSDSDFGSLQENLAEAWASSNQEKYKKSKASIRAMAKFDYLTNSQVPLELHSESQRREYVASKAEQEQKAWVSGYWIRPNPRYWKIKKPSGNVSSVSIHRSDSKVESSGWLNFRNFSLLRNMDTSAQYILKLEILSETNFELGFFFHFFGRSIQRLKPFTVNPGRNSLTLVFEPTEESYSDLAITATEVHPGTCFELLQISLDRHENS